MTNMAKVARCGLAAAALALLSSCGGGGSGSSGGGGIAQTNRAPQITSPSSASFVENTQGAIYTMSATDADGDTVSYSITGGADQSSFEVDGNRLVITFAPNFDQPNDVNEDNIFEVYIAATDGRGGRATRDLQLEVTNDREGIRVTRILDGLTEPVGITPTFGTARELAVGLRNGSYIRFDGNRSSGDAIPAPVVLFPAGADFERMIDIAWGADGTFWRGPMVLFQNSFAYRIFRPEAGLYLEGNATFSTVDGIDGKLFIGPSGEAFAALGDPAGEYAQIDPPSAEDRFGRIFRIEGSCGASLRSLCANPIGYGIRDPGGFVQYNDLIGFADRGESAEHELSLFSPLWRPLNFGWPFREGSTVLQAGEPNPLVGPTLVYPVGDGRREGTGIVMGAGYTGSIPGIANHLVFGDTDGSIWSIPIELVDGQFLRFVDVMQLRNEDFAPDVGTLDSIVEIATDASGVLYILDSDGEVFRVDPA